MQIVRDNDCVELLIGKWPPSAFQIGLNEVDVGLACQSLGHRTITIHRGDLAAPRGKKPRVTARTARDVQNACSAGNVRGPTDHPSGCGFADHWLLANPIAARTSRIVSPAIVRALSQPSATISRTSVGSSR